MPDSEFRAALEERNPGRAPAQWVFVPYDQLTDRFGPLAAANPGEIGIVMIESAAKGSRRPYHKQKLALVLANQRHFALEQAARGVPVRYESTRDGYAARLAILADELGPMRLMRPAERELRAELATLVESGSLEVVPHEGWLSTTEDFERACGDPPWRMDAFYRHMRKRTGWLMKDGRPEGGKLSFDASNRKPWRGDPEPPELPRYPRDSIKEEVCRLVDGRFPKHPGRLDPDSLPATRADAGTALHWAIERCLPAFGPYEDAMARDHRTLWHTRLSALLNLQRVQVRDLVEAALASNAPIASREGLLRQLLGWREFVRHVHDATDGLRDVPHNVLEARNPLPPAYWGEKSGLACLDEIVASVWEEGYSHHITRLMVLSNIAMLLDVDPRELTDWFWVAYVDAYDWVVEPNVLGMGAYATGDLMITKPYVAGANYIHKMSDYCESCRFDPKKNCPLTDLYWAFLARHEGKLKSNPRMRMPLSSLGKRDSGKRETDRETFRRASETLGRGDELS